MNVPWVVKKKEPEKDSGLKGILTTKPVITGEIWGAVV